MKWLEALRPWPRPRSSARALERYLEAQVGDLNAASVEALITEAVGFYVHQRIGGLWKGEEADRLLFQYGCYDWGQGEAFELDITRQFVHDARGALSQLHATLYFEPDEALRALGRLDRWCERPADAGDFLSGVIASPALAIAKTRKPVRRAIGWERV